MILIGLTGFASAGKDTVADYLVEKYGFVKMSFAAKLKECMLTLNPYVPLGPEPLEIRTQFGFGLPRLRDLVDGYGWDKAKKIPEVRRLLQVFGTEVGRELLGQNVWVDILDNDMVSYIKTFDENGIAKGRIVITDCRFKNEVNFIKNYNGKIVRVERPGVGPLNSHASEKANELEVDLVIHNDGTLHELYITLDEFIVNLEDRSI